MLHIRHQHQTSHGVGSESRTHRATHFRRNLAPERIIVTTRMDHSSSLVRDSSGVFLEFLVVTVLTERSPFLLTAGSALSFFGA